MRTLLRDRAVGACIGFVSFFCVSLLFCGSLEAQSAKDKGASFIKGRVFEKENEEPIPGVHLVVLGTGRGTATNAEGDFVLKIFSFPAQVRVSAIGYQTQSLTLNNPDTVLLIALAEESIQLDEVIVSASLREQRYMESPISIERFDVFDIRQKTAIDYYDMLRNAKGVTGYQSGINYTTINTRGFGSVANFAFVQLVDWMDTSSPTLNFPTGNLLGLSELDVEQVEIVPGASSALYGPNAFNGLLISLSKSPFNQAGLSAQVKTGLSHSTSRQSTAPIYSLDMRYAKTWKSRFAFKLNLSYFLADDWIANDYQTDRLRPYERISRVGQPDFDGLNIYGDEIPIPIPLPDPVAPILIRRTGFPEGDLLGNDKDAQTIKADASLYYRFNSQLELVYGFRFGMADAIMHAADRFVLRGFQQYFHRVALTGRTFFVRGYVTTTRAGMTYSLGALGLLANEKVKDTRSWATDYATQYLFALQGLLPDVKGGDVDKAHEVARAHADRDRPERGSEAYNELLRGIRTADPQLGVPGARFEDQSTLYHVEFNKKFFDLFLGTNFQVGGNWRFTDLFSNGTIFNEDPETGLNPSPIRTPEWGGYLTADRGYFGNALTLNASLRVDGRQGFTPQLTPRLSGLWRIGPKQHFLRFSYQTAFRVPDSQAQFLYLLTADGILLGSSAHNAERYGLHGGGVYSLKSYEAYLASGAF